MVLNIYNLILTLIFIINATSLANTTNDVDSLEDDVYAPGDLVLPKQIFNDGKPFYVEKDPISGQLDFSSKKPAGIEPENNEIFAPKEKIVLSGSSPNIHDFLNLPVKYSSSKFVYPLVSSSYANLKYQGNNKNYISSQKNNFPPTVATTISPSYYTLPKKDITTVKPKSSTTTKFPVTKQIAVTTFRPTFKTTLETKTSTTIRNIPSIFDRSTPKNKYIPTKKYSTTVSHAPVSTEKYPKPNKYTKYTTTTPVNARNTTKTTVTNPTPSTIKSTSKISSTIRTTTKIIKTTIPFKTSLSTTMMPKKNITFETTTKAPISSTVQTSVRPKLPEVPFFPLPTERPEPTTVDPADVYSKVEKKNERPLFMSDIFNALAGEEDDEELSEGLDINGNLMHPFSPSKPSPFTLQQVTKATFPKNNQTKSTVQHNLDIKLNVTDNKNKMGNGNSSLIHTANMIFQQHDKPKFTTSEQSFSNGEAINSDEGFTNEQTENSQSNQYVDEYVNYQVQQPNMQYHPIPSMNNVVISPGQNSASFVLGSQQAVGSSNVYIGSIEKESLFQRKPIQFGTVISEEINPHLVENTKPTKLPLYQEPEQKLFNSQQMTHLNNENIQNQDVQGTSNIRFPSGPGQQNEFVNDNSPESTVNGHAQPLSMQQLQQQGIQKPLVFPKPEQELDLQPPHNPIVFKPDSATEDIPQKQEVLTLNQHLQNKMNYPQLPEDLTPPAEPQIPEPSREINRPNTPQGYVPPFTRHEFTRRPLSNLHRSDRPLPNILPQFRPNSKISAGHSHHLKEPGTIRVTSKYPYRPLFSQRRQPLTGNRYRINNEPPTPPQEANRRVYRVPSPSNSYMVYHHYPQRLPQYMNHPLRVTDGYMGTSPPPSSLNGVPPVPQTQFQSLSHYPVYKNGGDNTERLAAFEENDYPVKESDFIEAIEKIEEQPKLEPVVTLQMLQSQKKNSNTFDDQIGEKPAASQPTSSSSDLPDLQKKQGVYVVYPAKAVDYIPDEKQQEDIGSNGNAADYQNTPFSVVRDQPQEPILVVKNKPQQNKEKFPYPLEKPDPVYAELTKKDKYHIQPSIELLPRVVNRRRDEITTEIPIAIAYTPTAPNRYYTNHKFSYPNLAGPVIKEIRETQTEAAMDDISDNRGHNYEKDFMAPFYPSMSLESATDSPNGWSVYQQQQQQQQEQQQQQQLHQQQQQTQQQYHDQQIHQKQNINRIDSNKEPEQIKMEVIETTTKKYDPDSFQVELHGGFKPIYPPDYHLRDAANSNEMEFMNEFQQNFDHEEPLERSSATSQAALTSTTPLPEISTKLKLVEETKPIKISEKLAQTTIAPLVNESTTEDKLMQQKNSTIKSITNTTLYATSTTSELPPQRKKQPSLVSLLFGDYDDDDYDEKGTTESYLAS